MNKNCVIWANFVIIILMFITPATAAVEYKTIKGKILSNSSIQLDGLIKNLVKTTSMNLRFLYVVFKILIQGVLLPTVLTTLILLLTNKLALSYPVISYLIAFIGGSTTALTCFFPILKMFIDLSSHKIVGFTFGSIVYFLLGFITLRLSNFLFDRLTGITTSYSFINNRNSELSFITKMVYE